MSGGVALRSAKADLLLVAPDAPTRAAHARALEAAGYRVLLAAALPEAQAALRELRVDLVLVDRSVAGAEEPEALVAAVRGRGVPLPVVVLDPAVADEPRLVARSLRAGAFAHLSTAACDEQLLQAVELALKTTRLDVERDALKAETERLRRRLAETLRDEGRAAARARELEDARTQIAALERHAKVGLLAAGLVHDLRNSLASVAANITFLKVLPQDLAPAHPAAAETLREAIDEVDLASRHILAVLEDVRLMARGGAGASAAAAELVDVNTCLGAALRLVHYRLTAGVTLVDRREAGLPPVRGSRAQLTQVFVDLLINAAEALVDDIGARRRIEISSRLEGGAVVVLVRDSGPGVPPELRERIFDALFTTKPANESAGMGLTVSRALVEAHGGQLILDEGAPLPGTVMRVTLPAARPVAAAADAPSVARAEALAEPLARGARDASLHRAS
ncbi:MAG TPA: ATP-binding protein [Myxococcota bacterium]|nr:ATP-binding protein [Myxococcota bacterium]